MSNHNICLYKEIKKKRTGCNLKITEFLDCALIGVCAVIRSNMVINILNKVLLSAKKYLSFFLFLNENIQVLIRSTHNVCFHGEIRKILILFG